ncbi:MAG TPA: hypothetical protein PKE69_05165 [Pyrinomonadaceae bacterium]|nr:hypothetical protein [Pyrinomonadaceae bacterium]
MNNEDYSLFEDDLQAIWIVVNENLRQVSLIVRNLERIEKTLSEVLTELQQRPDCLDKKSSN